MNEERTLLPSAINLNISITITLYLPPFPSKMAKASVYLSLRISLSDMARGIADPL